MAWCEKHGISWDDSEKWKQLLGCPQCFADGVLENYKKRLKESLNKPINPEFSKDMVAINEIENMIEVLEAYRDGKAVQCMLRNNGQWQDVEPLSETTSLFPNFLDNKYRIKPDKPYEGIIGAICNYYGNLEVEIRDDKYFWAIEKNDGYVWEEIPKSLYDELVAFHHSIPRDKWGNPV